MAALFAHAHVWRILEVEFLEGASVRRYECACGETDYQPD